MANLFGSALTLAVFGQSHAPALGCTIEGLPAGYTVDEEQLQRFLDRRAPGNNPTATSRKEADKPEILCGIADGVTCGAPLTAIIRNTNTRSHDYDELRCIPRPGHADYPAYVRYGGHNDIAGGGQFSGRLTAPICIAGGIAKQILDKLGIHVIAHAQRIACVDDTPLDPMAYRSEQEHAILSNALPCIDGRAATRMQENILAARSEGDSVGGIVECAAYGPVPAGIGEPMFGGIENRIAQMAFGIPAVKGVEFGAGFGSADLKGSENNDPYGMRDSRVTPLSNNAGGCAGGMTTGAPIVWRMAVKPTPSIARPQQSVDLSSGSNAELAVRGRHDPCIVPRAVPVAEAVCAFVLLDALLQDGAVPRVHGEA